MVSTFWRRAFALRHKCYISALAYPRAEDASRNASRNVSFMALGTNSRSTYLFFFLGHKTKTLPHYLSS